MDDLVDFLRHRARALHRAAVTGDASAQGRLRGLPDLRDLDDATLASTARRRHALAALARDLGFDGWPHATAVLTGKDRSDAGRLLYPAGASAHWNIWSAHYDEARGVRAEHGGYLLPWRKHFLIVDADFVRWLGLDPDDPDWALIARDWARPADEPAWARLCRRLIDGRLAGQSPSA